MCAQRVELQMQSSVTDASLAYLAPLSALRMLSLKGCTNISGPGLSAITGLAHLRALDCTGCTRLTNKGAPCPRLAVPPCLPTCIPPFLHISPQPPPVVRRPCGIAETAVPLCPPFTRWKQAQGAGTVCMRWVGGRPSRGGGGAAGLEHVALLTALTGLTLRECRLVTNDGLRRLEPLAALKALSLSGCTSVSDRGLQSLAQLTGAAPRPPPWVPPLHGVRRCRLHSS